MRDISGNRPETPPSDAGGLPPYPHGSPFGTLLKWHLKIHGTRPTGSPTRLGHKWLNSDFAEAIGLADDRMLSRWFRNLNAPSNIETICEVLFGNNQEYKPWRETLRSAAKKLEHATKPKSHETQAKTLPNVFVNLPPKTTNFLWRKRELRWLCNKLVPRIFRRWHSVAIIHSFGGVGKTSLSIEFAYENAPSFAGVWWCDAESTASLTASIGRLGDALNIKRTGSEHSPIEAKRVLVYLASQKQNWLLIYDNASDPKSIRDYIPRGAVKVLVTSRFSDWVDLGPTYPLEILSPSESIQLLNQITGRTDNDGAGRLAHKVGRLPLALNHAAIMCRRCRYTFDEYSAHAEAHIRVNMQSVDYEASVFAVFESTMMNIGLDTPAVTLLMFLSFCGSSPISLQLFEKSLVDTPSVAGALTALSEISLIQFGVFHEDKRYVVVHKIIQSVVRIKAKELNLADFNAAIACDGIGSLLPDRLDLNEINRYNLEILTPHIYEIFERDRKLLETVESFPKTVWMGALYASAVGMYDLAETTLAACCEIYKSKFLDLDRIYNFESGNWQLLSDPVWNVMFESMKLPSDRVDRLKLYSSMIYNRAQNKAHKESRCNFFEILKMYDVVLCLTILIKGPNSSETCTILGLTRDWLKRFNCHDEAEQRYSFARKLYTSSHTIEMFVAADFSLSLVSVLFPESDVQLVVLQKRFELLTAEGASIPHFHQLLSDESPVDVLGDELMNIANLIGDILCTQEHWRGSFIWFKYAYELTKEIYGVNHPKVALSRNVLGVSLIHAGRVRWGRAMCKNAISDFGKMIGIKSHYYTNPH